MLRTAAALLVPLCLAAASPGDEEDRSVTVAGRILDAGGQPVAEATVATHWSFAGGALSAHEGLLTDEAGLFEGTIDVWRYPVQLAAYTSDRDLAGVVSVEEADVFEIEFVLQPSVRVRGRVTREGVDRPLDRPRVSLTVDEFRLSIAPDDGRFDVRLPRGELSWMIYDDYFSMVTGSRALDADARDVDLGVFDIPAAFLALHEGKELPEWTVSAARNLPLDQSGLAAHRGKWLLIEFWGFW